MRLQQNPRLNFASSTAELRSSATLGNFETVARLAFGESPGWRRVAEWTLDYCRFERGDEASKRVGSSTVTQGQWISNHTDHGSEAKGRHL